MKKRKLWREAQEEEKEWWRKYRYQKIRTGKLCMDNSYADILEDFYENIPMQDGTVLDVGCGPGFAHSFCMEGFVPNLKNVGKWESIL